MSTKARLLGPHDIIADRSQANLAGYALHWIRDNHMRETGLKGELKRFFFIGSKFLSAPN